MAALPNIGGALCSTPQFYLTRTSRVPCSNAAKTRNPLKFAGVPETRQPISAVSGPKLTMLRGHVEDILLLNKFFPIVDTCLSYEDGDVWKYSRHPKSRHLRTIAQLCGAIPTKLCDGAQMATFCVLYFQRAACSTFQTCILNSH